VVRAVPNIVVRELCDYCVVELREEDGTTRRLMANSADPAKAHLCEMLLHVEIDRRRRFLGSTALETRRPALFAEVTEDMLRELAQSPHHLRLLRAIAPRSLMELR